MQQQHLRRRLSSIMGVLCPGLIGWCGCWQPDLVMGVCGLTADQPIARSGACCFQILLVKTLGVQLRLLPEIIANPSEACRPNRGDKGFAEDSATDRTRYVANTGGTPRVDPDQVTFGRAGIIIANQWRHANPSQDVGEYWLKRTKRRTTTFAETAGVGRTAEFCVNVAALGILLRYALSDLPWGSACCGPAGETTANFTFGRLQQGCQSGILEASKLPKRARTSTMALSG